MLRHDTLRRSGRAEGVQVAGEGERRPGAQAPEAEVAGERRRPDDAKRAVRVPPVGTWKVTRTSDPTWAPT